MLIIKHYRKTKTVISYIRYHIVFCTRFRRKLFSDPKLSLRVCDLIEEKCRELTVKVIMLKSYDSSIEMIIECPPDLSPNQIVYRIKSHCNVGILEKEFEILEKTPNLWTRSCLISTNLLDDETVKGYVLSQKSRPDNSNNKESKGV